MNTSAQAKATRREWIGLGVIALPCMLYSMDLTVLNLALPALAAELDRRHLRLPRRRALITMGALGDRIAAGGCS